MNRHFGIAGVIWLAVSTLMAESIVPATVKVFAPDWATWGPVTWIDVVLPSLMLVVAPGALLAATYLAVAHHSHLQ